jgi:hypothetical protein
MLNYISIVIVLLFIIFGFYKNYYKGLYYSIFSILLFPENMCIAINISLPTLTIQRLVLIVMFFFWFFNKNINKNKNIFFMQILILLSISNFISIFLSPIYLVAFKRYFYFLFESIIFFLIIQTSIKDRIVLNNIIKSVAYSLLFLSIVGIIQRYTGIQPHFYFGDRLSYDFQKVSVDLSSTSDVTSFYNHRIHFGIACSIGTLYFLYLSVMEKNKKLLYVFFSLVTMISLYFSFSRGPWLSLFLAFSFLVIVYPKIYFKKAVIFLLLSSTILIIRPGIFETLSGYYNNTLDPTTVKGSSFNWRFTIMNLALNNLLNSPSVLNIFFGYGLGSVAINDFGTALLTTNRTVEIESWDCEFASKIYQEGIFGVALLLYIYFLCFYKGLIYFYHKTPHPQEILLCLSCILVFIFMKINVSIFSSQLVYCEYINFAIISYFLSRNSLSENTKYTHFR